MVRRRRRHARNDVAASFHKLCRVGPQYGYFPEPAKSWAVCAQDDKPELKRIFAAAKLPVKWSCDRRYVGGFVGSKAMERKWVEEKAEESLGGVWALARIPKRYPQTAYTGFVVCCSRSGSISTAPSPAWGRCCGR